MSKDTLLEAMMEPAIPPQMLCQDLFAALLRDDGSSAAVASRAIAAAV